MCSCMSFVSSSELYCAASFPACVGHLFPSRPPALPGFLSQYIRVNILIQSHGVVLAFAKVFYLFAASLALPAMEPQRPTFCGLHQTARQVRGRPVCVYTRQSCLHGLHACQLCGKGGHGAEECRTYAAPPIVVPPRPPRSPPQRPVAPSTKKARPVGTSKASGGMPPDVGVDSTTLAPSPSPAVPAPSAETAPAEPLSSSIFHLHLGFSICKEMRTTWEGCACRGNLR